MRLIRLLSQSTTRAGGRVLRPGGTGSIRPDNYRRKGFAKSWVVGGYSYQVLFFYLTCAAPRKKPPDICRTRRVTGHANRVASPAAMDARSLVQKRTTQERRLLGGSCSVAVQVRAPLRTRIAARRGREVRTQRFVSARISAFLMSGRFNK